MAKKKKTGHPAGPFFLLVVLPLLAIGLSGWAMSKGIQNYITTSHYFKIRELRIEGIRDQDYLDSINNEVVGVNIFRLNAADLAAKIRRRFPRYYSVTVRRVLPSQLLIVARERLPVACLKKDAFYLIDANGVVVGSRPLTQAPSLPVLSGLENKFGHLSVGTTYASPGVRRALVLAKILKVHADDIRRALGDASLTVTRIDVTQGGEFSFFLGDRIEVKVGDRNFDARVTLLPSILKTILGDMDQVLYIDLRPKEPVVATKESKKR